MSGRRLVGDLLSARERSVDRRDGDEIMFVIDGDPDAMVRNTDHDFLQAVPIPRDVDHDVYFAPEQTRRDADGRVGRTERNADDE